MYQKPYQRTTKLWISWIGLPIVYKLQVRPHLEYGNTIWHPRYIADMKNVEGVQCRATKVSPELRDKPYHERLQSLNLYSMEYRRKGGDMIQTYKILKRIDRIYPLLKQNIKGPGAIAWNYSNLDLNLSLENLHLVKGS